MKKRKYQKTRKLLVEEIEFTLGKNQYLVVNESLFPRPGLDRVIVQNENGRTRVSAMAVSGSRIEFQKGKIDPYAYDFWIGNTNINDYLYDTLKGKFWSQFNWGELAKYQKPKFEKQIDEKIEELVTEFMAHAATALNKIKKPL